MSASGYNVGSLLRRNQRQIIPAVITPQRAEHRRSETSHKCVTFRADFHRIGNAFASSARVHQ